MAINSKRVGKRVRIGEVVGTVKAMSIGLSGHHSTSVLLVDVDGHPKGGTLALHDVNPEDIEILEEEE